MEPYDDGVIRLEDHGGGIWRIEELFAIPAARGAIWVVEERDRRLLTLDVARALPGHFKPFDGRRLAELA